VRIVAGWLASHPETPALVLDPPPDRAELERFVVGAASGPPAASRPREPRSPPVRQARPAPLRPSGTAPQQPRR
jgi:hypothetical protein